MASAREQGRKAFADAWYAAQPITEHGWMAPMADAVSDVWRPIANTFRHHRPTPVSRYCTVCLDPWPCPAWMAAEEAMDG